jgi:hypothetical protein
MKANATVAAALLALGCAPPAPMPDASFDSGVDTAPIVDAGTDAYEPDDAFTLDASLGDILCTGMPVPRGLPCELQDSENASGCGGTGRVVYARNSGACQLATGAECGPVRGAFNTLEECAMACGRVARAVGYPAEFYLGRSGGENGRRMGSLDFTVPCESILRAGEWPHESSRCAHFGLLAPLYTGASSVPVPATMSNQEVWELLNAAYLVGDMRPGRGALCVAPL